MAYVLFVVIAFVMLAVERLVSHGHEHQRTRHPGS